MKQSNMGSKGESIGREGIEVDIIEEVVRSIRGENKM